MLRRWIPSKSYILEKLALWKHYAHGCMSIFFTLYVLATLLALLFNLDYTFAVTHYHDTDGEQALQSIGFGIAEIVVGLVCSALVPVCFFVGKYLLIAALVISFFTGSFFLSQAQNAGTHPSEYFYLSLNVALNAMAALFIMWLLKIWFKIFILNNVDFASSRYSSEGYGSGSYRSNERPVLTDYHIPGYRQRMEQQERAEQEKNRQWAQEIKARDESIKNWMYNK